MKKALVFGVGNQYKKFIRQIAEDFEVIGLTDNDVCRHGTTVDGTTIISPEKAVNLEFDAVIVTPYNGRDEIIRQLLSLGVDSLKILNTASLTSFLIDPMFFSMALNDNDKKILFKNNVETIYLEANSKCNRKCWFCPNSFLDRHSDNMLMPIELVSKVCDELSQIDYAGTIDFSYYNEPLLDYTLEDKIALVKEKLPKVKIHIVTNGDYLNKTRIATLEKAGLERIIISNYFSNSNKSPWTYELAKKVIQDKADTLSLSIDFITKSNDIECYAVACYGNLNITMNCINFSRTGYHRAGLLKDTINSIVDRKTMCSHAYNGFIVAYTGEVVFCTQCHNGSTEHKKYIVGDINKDNIFNIFTSNNFTSLRKSTLCDVNSAPCTGCSSTITNLVYTPPCGPFMPRPRDAGYGIDYLEHSLIKNGD